MLDDAATLVEGLVNSLDFVVRKRRCHEELGSVGALADVSADLSNRRRAGLADCKRITVGLDNLGHRPVTSPEESEASDIVDDDHVQGTNFEIKRRASERAVGDGGLTAGRRHFGWLTLAFAGRRFWIGGQAFIGLAGRWQLSRHHNSNADTSRNITPVVIPCARPVVLLDTAGETRDPCALAAVLDVYLGGPKRGARHRGRTGDAGPA
jgi:hypothetical protein